MTCTDFRLPGERAIDELRDAADYFEPQRARWHALSPGETEKERRERIEKHAAWAGREAELQWVAYERWIGWEPKRGEDGCVDYGAQPGLDRSLVGDPVACTCSEHPLLALVADAVHRRRPFTPIPQDAPYYDLAAHYSVPAWAARIAAFVFVEGGEAAALELAKPRGERRLPTIPRESFGRIARMLAEGSTWERCSARTHFPERDRSPRCTGDHELHVVAHEAWDDAEFLKLNAGVNGARGFRRYDDLSVETELLRLVETDVDDPDADVWVGERTYRYETFTFHTRDASPEDVLVRQAAEAFLLDELALHEATERARAAGLVDDEPTVSHVAPTGKAARRRAELVATMREHATDPRDAAVAAWVRELVDELGAARGYAVAKWRLQSELQQLRERWDAEHLAFHLS